MPTKKPANATLRAANDVMTKGELGKAAFYVTLFAGMGRTAGLMLRSKDANTTGLDDRLGLILEYAGAASEAVLNYQPIPPMPEELTKLNRSLNGEEEPEEEDEDYADDDEEGEDLDDEEDEEDE